MLLWGLLQLLTLPIAGGRSKISPWEVTSGGLADGGCYVVLFAMGVAAGGPAHCRWALIAVVALGHCRWPCPSQVGGARRCLLLLMEDQ